MSLIQSVFVGAEGSLLGRSVAGVGDVNGDGYQDFVVGQPRTTYSSGPSYSFVPPYAAVVFGNANGAPATTDISSLDPSEGFILTGGYQTEAGLSVAGIGDVNGDGYDDLLIGAPRTNFSGEPQTYVRTYTSYFYTAQANGNYFFSYVPSYSVSYTYNGNTYFNFYGPYSSYFYTPGNGSYTRVANTYTFSETYTPNYFNAGAAFVVFGTDDPLVDEDNRFSLSEITLANNYGSTEFGFVINGGVSGQRLGQAVAGVGDFDGDGGLDIAVSSSGTSYYTTYGAGPRPDAVFVLPGSPSTYTGSVGTTLRGQYDSDFGEALDGGGDFNGDGFSDIIVGAEDHRIFSTYTFTTYFGSYSSYTRPVEAGAAHIFFGSSSAGGGSTASIYSFDGSNGFSFVSEQGYADMGSDVANIGDINGDGFDDFLVGAQSYDVPRETPLQIVYSYQYTGYFPQAGGSYTLSFIPTYTMMTTYSGVPYTYIYGGYSRYTPAPPGTGNFAFGQSTGYSTYTLDSYYDAGAAFVLFGQDGGMSQGVLGPSDLTPDLGFMIHNDGDGEHLGASVAGVGDVNGDGFADFAVTDQIAEDPYYFYTYSGGRLTYEFASPRVHIVFGTDAAPNGDLDVGTLDGSNGFTINLEEMANPYFFGDRSLADVAGTDFNGDGISDIVIGQPDTFSGGYVPSPGEPRALLFSGGSNERWAYIDGLDGNVDGQIDAALAATPIILGDTGDDDLLGTGGDDRFVGLGGDDTLNGAAGDDTAVFGVARADAVVTELLLGYQIATSDGTTVMVDVEEVEFTDGMFAVEDLNTVPTVTLENAVTSIDENTSTAARIKVADIAVADDGFGDNILSLSGSDAGLFEIDGTELFLLAGTTLDFEDDDGFEVTVEVDDTRIIGDPEDSAALALAVTNLNEAPTGGVTITGTPIEEEVLTAVSTLDDPDGNGTLAYQWLRDGAPIAGATAATYLLVADDIGADVSVRVSYTDGGGFPESATSDATDPIEAADPSFELVGDEGSNALDGGIGNDTINGAGGNDTIKGGAGNDNAGGGDGNDEVSGGDGNDSLGGGTGDDTVTGGTGNDTIGGGLGNDKVQGNAGDDIVNGGAGDDTVQGGAGNDTMGGSFGADVVLGGPGNDSLGGGAGSDSIDGGDGDDAVGGGEGDDTITGGEGNDFLAGGGRNDDISGDAGNDTINGGDGDDRMSGGDGADVFVFNFFKDGDADVITDFEDGIDSFRMVGVENAPGSGLAGKVAALNILDTAAGALIDYQGHRVLVQGVDASSLTVDDFTFL